MADMGVACLAGGAHVARVKGTNDHPLSDVEPRNAGPDFNHLARTFVSDGLRRFDAMIHLSVPRVKV
jgi:hypothetical protein